MRSDDGANKSLYGKELSAKQIVQGGRVKISGRGTFPDSLLDEFSSPHHAK